MKIKLLSILFLVCLISISNAGDSLFIKAEFGSFSDASSITICRKTFIFVADKSQNTLYKFDLDGNLLIKSGASGFGSYELSEPISLDATNGLDLFVCERRNNRIQKFDLNFNPILTFDFNSYNYSNQNIDKVFNPGSICVLATSDIFAIYESTKNRVVKLKTFSSIESTFGSVFGVDRLKLPTKIISGKDLDVWILDNEGKQISNYDNTGVLLNQVQIKLNSPVLSITRYEDKLYLLTQEQVLIYGLSKKAYIEGLSLQKINSKFVDIISASNNSFYILTKEKVYNYTN